MPKSPPRPPLLVTMWEIGGNHAGNATVCVISRKARISGLVMAHVDNLRRKIMIADYSMK